MSKNDRPAWLTVEEIAQELRVHPRTVRRYLSAGELRGVRLGKGYRVSREDFERWLAERST